MIFLPHPIVMTRYARQQSEELQAQAQQFRMENPDRNNGQPHRPRLDLDAIAGIVLGMALPLVA